MMISKSGYCSLGVAVVPGNHFFQECLGGSRVRKNDDHLRAGHEHSLGDELLEVPVVQPFKIHGINDVGRVRYSKELFEANHDLELVVGDHTGHRLPQGFVVGVLARRILDDKGSALEFGTITKASAGVLGPESQYGSPPEQKRPQLRQGRPERSR